jgi:hypothetical protein
MIGFEYPLKISGKPKINGNPIKLKKLNWKFDIAIFWASARFSRGIIIGLALCVCV